MKNIVTVFLISFSLMLLAATADESIQQAKAKFAAGNTTEAIAILDGVVQREPGNLQAKRILADICVDTGEREYEFKNFKNAYEYFKKAVKLLPTHPIASERYWKMKNDFDVNNLKNEGGTISAETVKDDSKTTAEKDSDADKTGKTPGIYGKKAIKKIETNPRLAEEIYTKKIFEMEERFNKRLLEVNKQIKKSTTADQERRGIAGFMYTIGAEPKLLILSLAVLIIIMLLLAASTYYFINFIKKQLSLRRGGKEYDRLFGEDTSRNYNELIKMQNIKELLNKIKSGELDWNTIKRSISEMDKELRLEIFSYIESKSDPHQQPLTMGQADILMALILDGDEYLRKRASSFVAGQLSRPAGEEVKRLQYFAQGSFSQRQPVALLTDQTSSSPALETSILYDLNIVLPLSKIVDRKVFNDNHASRVGVDAYDMAGILGLSKEESTLYYIAGLLHDVGYLDIPSEILNKKTSLSEKDFDIIKTHTKRGIALLDFTEIPQTVKDGILFHHEKWTGGGYPDGLIGEDIPLVARVVGIFDMYEALLLPRPQRPPFPPKEALRIIKKGSGTMFDPELVKMFEKMIKNNLVSRENIWKD